MKILFLDIDGVLNRHDTVEKCGPFIGVDRRLSERLLRWMAGKEIWIVLSSTWRNHPEMHSHLNEAGISWIGVTPQLHSIRGMEIQAWLAERPEIRNYVILDDSSDMLPEQLPRFVQTNYHEGLQPADLARMEHLFAGG